MEQLLGEVQASRQEIASVLPSLGVTEIDGKMRMISRAAFREVVRTLLDTILEHNWNLDHIDETECVRVNPGLDPVLLRALLGQLGVVKTESGEGGRCVWELNYDRLARAAAEDMFVEHVSSSRQEVQFYVNKLVYIRNLFSS